MRNSPSPQVEFLIAGVQKGGTTALFDYLAGHPGLRLPAIKEAHFFDDETLDWADPDYGPYHALFAPSPARWGEATPIYLYWPRSLERIARYNPAMRLVLIFRDPVERAWSHWKMEYARGAETRPFAWCIREGRARVQDDPTAPGHHRVYSYVERGFYGAQVRRVLALFPREQVLFLKSEQLRADPVRILREVCDFLHCPPLEGVVPLQSHTSVEMDYGVPVSAADRAYLRDLFFSDYQLFRTQTGIDFASFT